jgi:hypothetical protein
VEPSSYEEFMKVIIIVNNIHATIDVTAVSVVVSK